MKRIIIIAFCALFTLFASAQQDEKGTILSIKIGGFFPSDPQIKGMYVISFEPNGSQSGVLISGFGNGITTTLEAIHYFSEWGLRFESGIRIHDQHNINLNHTNGNDTYENSLTIIPVILGPVYRLPIESKTEVYISPAIGYFYGNLKQKHKSTDLMSADTVEEVAGTESSIGLNIIAGVQFPIYYDLMLGFDISYSLIQSNWKIKDASDNSSFEYSINTGGVGLNLSLKYRF